MSPLDLTAVISPIAGDYNRGAIVDDGDYGLWKSTWGSTSEFAADGNVNGVVDAADYSIWRDNFGAQIESPEISEAVAAEQVLAPAVLEAAVQQATAQAIVVDEETRAAAMESPSLTGLMTPLHSSSSGFYATRNRSPDALSPIAHTSDAARANALQLCLIRKHHARVDVATDISSTAFDEALTNLDAKESAYAGSDDLVALGDETLRVAL